MNEHGIHGSSLLSELFPFFNHDEASSVKLLMMMITGLSCTLLKVHCIIFTVPTGLLLPHSRKERAFKTAVDRL